MTDANVDAEFGLVKKDSFNDSSIDAMWTILLNNGVSITEDSALNISIGTVCNWDNSNKGAPIIHTPAPAADLYEAKVKINSSTALQWKHMGIVLFTDMNNAYMFGQYHTSAMQMEKLENNVWTISSTGVNNSTIPAWIKVRYNSGEISFFYSTDDSNYILVEKITATFTPDKIGLFVKDWSAGSATVTFKDFHVSIPSLFDGFVPTIQASNGYVTAPAPSNTAFEGNVPTILASNGMVNPTSVGEAVFDGYAPLTYSSPPFFFKNSAGLKTHNIDIESLYAGIKSKVQTITAVNNTPVPIEFVLSPKESENQLGLDIDTYKYCCYLSEDNEDWSGTSLSLMVPAYGEKDFYIFYQPSSRAKIGLKQWELSQRNENLVNVEVLSEYFWAKCINIEGGPTSQTDANVVIVIDIDVNKMQTKAEEIRFCLADGTPLDFTELSVNKYLTAFYLVTIPELPASPDSVDIYAYVGDFTAISIANQPTTRIDFSDGTLDPFINDWRTSVAFGTWKGQTVGVKNLHIEAIWNSDGQQCHMPSTQIKGYWELNFKAVEKDNSLFYFYFIRNATESYCVRIFQRYDDVNELPSEIALYKNDSTVLDSDATIEFHGATEYNLVVTRDSNGLMKVYLNGVLLLEATDNSITSSQNVYLRAYKAGWWGGTGCSWDVHDFLFIDESENNGASFTDWLFYALLECRGEILYSSRDLPGIDPEIRVGCKIGSNYYE